MQSWADAMGWVGGIVAACAYVLVARGRVAPDSARFHAVNVAAAALLAVAAFSHDALPSAVMNLAWISFGGWSVAASLRRVARPLPEVASHPTPSQVH